MAVRFFFNGKLQAAPFAGEARAAPMTPVADRREGGLAQETPEKGLPATALSGPEQAAAALKALAASRRFVALSLPTCRQCDELGALLAARGVPQSVFTKWDKSSPDYQAQKKALSEHAGASFTFPQVFADGVYQGGFDEVCAKLEAGAYDQLFEEEFDATPSTVRRCVEKKPMVVFSLPQCPQCDELRDCLEKRGLPVGQIFVKWDKAAPQYQALKRQLIELMGGRTQFTFPQSFVRAEYQGSFDEMIEKVQAGTFDTFFQEAFGVSPPAPAASSSVAAGAPMDLAFDDDF